MISRSDEIHPRDMFEREVMKKYGKNEARKIILDRRQYLSDNASYINSLESQQRYAKYAPRNEKRTWTLNIQEDDYGD